MKYRKKPIIVEAVQWLGHNADEIFDFIGKDNMAWDNAQLCVFTLEGVYRSEVGEYIIKGIKGEFYPCKPDIFEMTYEAVDYDPTPWCIECGSMSKAKCSCMPRATND